MENIRFIESLADAGFRFVGWSHKILRLDYTGYYADNESGAIAGTYNGAVLQMSARNGCAVYLAAYAVPENDGAFIVDISRTFTQTLRNDNDDRAEAQIDAARAADSLAEYHATKERDYQEAWSQGQQYASLLEDETSARTERRKLRADLAKVKRSADVAGISVPKSICDTLRATIKTLGADAARASEDAKRLLANCLHYNGTLADAFNDGAGSDILP